MTQNTPFTRQEVKRLPLGFTPSGQDQNRQQRRKMMQMYFKLLKGSKG